MSTDTRWLARGLAILVVIFVSLGGSSATFAQASPAADDRAELLFWESIRNSSNLADFREYLRQYPDGKFAGLARNKLAGPVPDPAQGFNWYVGGSGGQSQVKFSDDFLNIYSGGPTSTFSKHETSTAFKFYAGHRFSQYLAVEGGYVDFGSFTATREWLSIASTGPGSLTAKIEARGFFLDAVGVVPVASRFDFFAKAGAVMSSTKTTFTATGSARTASPGPPQDASHTGLGVKGGIGAAFHVARRLALRAEYELAFKVGDKTSNGVRDVGMMSLGAAYRF